MSNFNKKYKQVLNDYDIESIEIDNYDLFAKLKDKIKKEKSSNIAKAKESKMARRSKIDLLYEVVLNLKNEFKGLKTEFNEFKTEVKEEFSKVNSRLDKLENDVKIIKYEATKHG